MKSRIHNENVEPSLYWYMKHFLRDIVEPDNGSLSLTCLIKAIEHELSGHDPDRKALHLWKYPQEI
jgi:hypothetical protein